jgi:uncharacterized protein
VTIFAGHSLATLLLVAAAALIAGLARGFSGFGGALIFTPLASALVGPRVAAPILFLIDAVAAAPLIPNAWRNAQRGTVATMALGALVGTPLGAFVLLHADPTAIRWGLCVVVLAMLALLVSGWRYRRAPSAPVTIGVGAVAGFLSGFAQVGGPPVVAYWLGGTIPAATVRANIILFFAVTTVMTAVTYTAGGVLTANVFVLSLAVGPLYALGLWLGTHMFSRANEQTFRRACYVLIAAAAVISLPLWDRLR